MNFLQHITNFLKPSTVKCNTDLDNHYEASQIEDEFEAHIPEKKHRVPQYDQLLAPVLMVTGNYELIKGFKFEFGIPLSNYFVTSATWELPNSGTMEESPHPMMPPTQQKPIFTFTSQLVQDIRRQEPYTIMMGRQDSEGKIHAILIRKLSEKINLKLEGAFQNSSIEQGSLNAELNIESSDSHTNFKLQQGLFGVGISQRIHPNLILGFDFYHLPAQKISMWGYGLKAFIKNHSLFANYTPAQRCYNLGYMIPIKKGTQFVAHYKYDAHERSPSTILGFKQQYEEMDILGTVSSKGEVTTTAALRTPNYSLKLCAVANYLKENYTFGYGITLGQAI